MDTTVEIETLLTPEEVADRLKVKASWVYQAAQRDALPSVKVGRYVRFREADIAKWIADGGYRED